VCVCVCVCVCVRACVHVCVCVCVTSRRISLCLLYKYDNAVENSRKSSLQSIASKLMGDLTLEINMRCSVCSVLHCVQLLQ